MARADFVYLLASLNGDKWTITDQSGNSEGSDGRKYIDKINHFKRLINEYGDAKRFVFKLFSNGRTRIGNQALLNTFTAATDNMKKSAPKVKSMTLSPDEKKTIDIIHSSKDIRPKSLILSDVKWKYLVRSVLRGKNLMMTGPAGCGKTLAVTTVASALNRPMFYFNLGATQDPRSTLVGNTHYNKETGTYFADSTFVKAIQTENSVILLDELSRAHPEAWNILMTVLDETQRYLRIDESPDTPVVHVARGVSFLATANIGMEYTSTRTIDRAIADRFQILEMDLLSKRQQFDLIKLTFPKLDDSIADIFASIYDDIHANSMMTDSKLSSSISTRVILQAAGLVMDGFTIQEAAEVSIFPYFSNDGGVESERTYAKQVVQKRIPDSNLRNSNIFSKDDSV